MTSAIRILVSLAMIPATYLSWGFVLAEFNPFEWGTDARASMLVFGAIFMGACYTCPVWWQA